MLSDAFESFTQIFSPPFRKVMWKSVGLTAIVLFLLGLGLDQLASSLMPAAPAWLSWILSIAVALGLDRQHDPPRRAHGLAGRKLLPGRHRLRSIRRVLADVHCRYALRSLWGCDSRLSP